MIDLGLTRWPHEPVVCSVAVRNRTKIAVQAATGRQWLAAVS